MTHRRSTDDAIPVWRRVTRAGQRNHVIIRLDHEFGLGLADDIAAGDHVANVVRIEPDADVFHSASPLLSCAILTTFERNQNADVPSATVACADGRKPGPGVSSAHDPAGRFGTLCVKAGREPWAALSGARACNAVRVSARPRPHHSLDRVSEADP